MTARPFDDWSDEEMEALRELVNKRMDSSIGRREFGKAAAALGLGGLIGGGASTSMVGTASAGSNQVGQVGTSSSPVDVQAEDITATTVDTDSLAYDLNADTRKLIWEADYPESGYSKFTNFFAPTDFNNTTDPIWGFGWNFNQDGNRIDTSDAALGWQLEPRFDNGTQLITEMFMKGFKTGGGEFRPFQAGYYQSDDNYDSVMKADRAIRWDFTGLANNVTVLKAHDPGNGSVQLDTTFDKWILTDRGGGQQLIYTGGNFYAQGASWVGDAHNYAIVVGEDSGGTRHDLLRVDADDDFEVGDGAIPVDTQSAGEKMAQRGAPTTSELASGEVMRYVSDGTDSGSAGDLMYAINDAGTIKTQIIAAKSNAT